MLHAWIHRIIAAFILLLPFVAWPSSSTSSLLDPQQELMGIYNQPDSSFEQSLQESIKCNNEVKSIKNIISKFPYPSPRDISYKNHGFRQFGDECDSSKQREFYMDLLQVAKATPVNSTSQFSFPWFIENFSKVWHKWVEHNDSLKICNPIWLLECGKSPKGKDVCVCLNVKSLAYPIELEQEMIVNEACEDSGKCHDDPGKDGEVKNPDVPGFRCVAKELEIDPDADDEPTLSGCELNLQFLGKCFSDCNHNVECTVPRTRKLGDNNKHFLHRKVCCNKSKGCFADADKNKGQIMQIRSAVTWAGLLAVFVRLGALPA